MNIIIKWILAAVLIIFIGWITPGINIANFGTALIAVIVISLINAFIRPLVEFITLPINFLTLGLFSLIINALLFLLAGKLVPGIEIDSFWSAILGSILLSVLSPLINNVKTDSKK